MISNLIKGFNRKKDGINIAPGTYVTFINKNENMSIAPGVLASDTSIYYSTDNGFGESDGNWMLLDGTSTISIGKIVHMKGTSVSKTLYSDNRYTNRWIFNNASDLEIIGDLCYLLCDDINDTNPTTYLGQNAFSFMFYDCSSLTVAPELSATTLADSCYSYMFYGCTSLTTAPELPATTLANWCYNNMFNRCTSLTTAPELLATTLAERCYDSMFVFCTSLTVAPELPATTLADRCYDYMFANCSSLTVAPELPATTLADYCYYNMFYNCTSLTVAPGLPATTLADRCCNNMFFGCTSLKFSLTKNDEYQKEYRIPKTGTINSAPSYWSAGMFEMTGGTFKGNPTINTTYYTTNTKVDTNTTPTYVTFINKNENMSIAPKVTVSDTLLYYSTDNGFGKSDGNWMLWDGTSTINIGKVVHMKGTSVSKTLYSSTSTSNKWIFNNTSDLKIIGDLCYLLCDDINDTSPTTYLGEYAFSYMFYNCTSLTVVPELSATTLANHCYQGMFTNCISLTVAPELPATTLAPSCYEYMFASCTSLTVAHTLPATTLADSCCVGMFYNCTSLTVAPELPATTLAHACYDSMFYNCTSLTVAPELPATTLATNCYVDMFRDCISLTVAPELPATTLVGSCYYRMFYNCTSLTVAPELPATTLADACYTSMFYGCTKLIVAPELPATTLADNCYGYMFYDCTSLKFSSTKNSEYQKEYRIPKTGTINNAPSYWNGYMFSRTGGTFKGNPTINTTYYTTN